MSVATPAARVGFSEHDAPDPATIATCVHCGLCLNECPTYRVLRLEMDSPRGRIQLTKAVSEGHMSLASPTFLKHTFRCLDCRACETACPSGVKYGEIIEDVRAQTVQAGLLPRPRRIADRGAAARLHPPARAAAGWARACASTNAAASRH